MKLSERIWPAPGRWALWGALVVLVMAMLGTVIWLASRYEASQWQDRVDRDVQAALSDIRAALNRNQQDLLALHSANPTAAQWVEEAAQLLRQHREIVRVEWRDAELTEIVAVDSPYRAAVFARIGRAASQNDLILACATARRQSSAAYSTSAFVPQFDGLGLELMDLCIPLTRDGHLAGYLIATYSLQGLLSEGVGHQLTRGQEISFTEADGTRLALHGSVARGNRIFHSQQLLDLPGNTLVLRMDTWRAAPDIFPNITTALVTLMSVALVSVMVMLGRDIQRRMKAEHELADALAFRKAMEDSLVTGLRARDLQGRITYVNPAFCEMVGFSPGELLGAAMPAPYWPPEMATEYGQRQALRLAGNSPPRLGAESVFMHKNGERFPVMIFEAPLITATGKQTGWMSAILDISDQKRAEEVNRATQDRLQATARLATVGEMASLLSHELNQPLAAIASYATGSVNLLGEAVPPAVELRTAMQRIAEQAERAGKVIRSVHDFVRRREQAREPVAPQALFDAVMPLVNLQARKLHVRVDLRCAPGLPAVHCDRTMVEQVLLNLSRNAMQAMDQPAITQRVLTLQASAGASRGEPPRWIEFSVADLGPGIDDDVARQLFKPFFTTKAEGMGLGLSLCRTVIEQHGGFLEYAANHPRGTVFRFTLPAYAAPAQQDGGAGAEASPARDKPVVPVPGVTEVTT